jgi:hypothetical protein
MLSARDIQSPREGDLTMEDLRHPFQRQQIWHTLWGLACCAVAFLVLYFNWQ